MRVPFDFRIVRYFILFLSLGFLACNEQRVEIILSGDSSVQVNYGVEKLAEELKTAGYHVDIRQHISDDNELIKIFIGEWEDQMLAGSAIEAGVVFEEIPGKEGFSLKGNDRRFYIRGKDASGALYGSLELADQIRAKGSLPESVNMVDAPQMVMRGTCIGLQKMLYLPGRRVYEYPYTPENFPWFYDKELWIEYLDMMVENRFNSLYLWNGHPFASLVRLDDYPYAVEVDDATFQKNEEMFDFLATEAEKRGIWVIQMFYNIIVSQPFAEHHGIRTQDRSRPIIPVVADYTRKSVAAFIEKYPHVGLMVALGEAMSGIENDIEWFTETIIPGVKDGLEALGIEEEPPIVLRGHDTNAKRVMEVAQNIYSNLYTVHKYNGESLTTYEPQDRWESIHQGLSSIGTVHISNVHILANLEPFRYGSPDFIQKSVTAMHDIQGANGLHLYPQTSYWDWPYTADNTTPRLKQVYRDWIWYETWGRYAWNHQRHRSDEKSYWSGRLADFYGISDNDGQKVLAAYEETGEIAPKLLRQFGISDGNRQTLLLGMFMSQLVNPYKYRVYPDFITSSGPDKEILIDWVEKEWHNLPHHGETPPQIIEETVLHGQRAVEAMEGISSRIGNNREEFERLKNDVYCYHEFALFFSEKVQAATHVLRYKYSEDLSDLELALPHLEQSLVHFNNLVELTKDTYLYANSMQTAMRRIPITGRDGVNKTWEEMLPHYHDELNNFRQNIEGLKAAEPGAGFARDVKPFQPVQVDILNDDVVLFELKAGAKMFSDRDNVVLDICEELKNLSAIRFSGEHQINQGTSLHFKTDQPVKLVVGYFNGHGYTLMQPPTLETNAHANERGQADVKIANALNVSDTYPVNVYTYDFEPGEHTLDLGVGLVLVLGFMDGEQEIISRDAGITAEGQEKVIDWLFF